MKFFKNPCNIYFSLWCLYLLQGTLYESGSIISQSILMLILLISLKDVYSVNRLSNLPVFFKGLNALFLMFTVYGLLLFVTDGWTYKRKIGIEVLSMNYLRTIYYSILPVYSCYLYAMKGYLNEQMYKKWVIVLVVIAITEFFRIQREQLEYYMNAGSDRTEFTNNIGYMILLLTPCAFIYKGNSKMQLFIYGICVLFIILAMKRGAILILAVAMFMYVNEKAKLVNRQKRFVFLIVLLILFAGLYGFIEEMLHTSEYFQERISDTLEGNSSGRDEIYSGLWHHFINEANPFQMIFGMGAEGTVKVFRIWAHNDWLEILTNQGVFGVFIFIFYWMMFRLTYKNKRYSEEAKFALKYLFVIFFLRTLFSMSISDMNIYSSSMLGYALADGFKRNYKFI